jgi:peroxiredoxin
MKRNWIAILFALLSSTSYGQEKKVYDEGYLVKIGDIAPDFTINEAGGKTYRLSDLKGKVVMLQFTASWCSVCRTEMPFIEKEIWQEKKDAGLIVIGIDRDEPVDKVLQFKKDIKVTYPLALDPGAEIFGLFAQKQAGVTRNIIIGRSGKILFLTRLYKKEEFNQMKKIIFAELSAK